MSGVELKVPDIGDFKDVAVVEVMVKVGDTLAVDDPLITIETEKASIDVPAAAAGVVESVAVRKGSTVSAGSVIAVLKAGPAAGSAPAPAAAGPAKAAQPAAPVRAAVDSPAATAPGAAPAAAPPAAEQTAARAVAAPATAAPRPSAAPADAVDLVVLGAGPGGYTAAFRAADLGIKVTLVERWPVLGGVCLNVGCIPSKALLHAAQVIEDARAMQEHGIAFDEPRIDRERLRRWKDGVITKLVNGLSALAAQRKVEVVQAEAQFSGPHSLLLKSKSGTQALNFKQCIIAAGSETALLPGLPDDPRVLDSSGALQLPAGCKRLLVIGGGIIGLEMACVYDALGAAVTVVELAESLMPGTDADLVRPLQRRLQKRYEKIMLATKVTRLEALPQGLRAAFEGPNACEPQLYDFVLVAVGRAANGNAIAAAAAGVACSSRGIIEVDRQMRTNQAHIFAVGDIVGAPMLAHKAMHQAKVAAEVAAGHKASFDARCIPSVAYTDPEIAWAGLTESEAKQRNIDYGKGSFPWAASGRSLSMGRDEGLTKILFDKSNQRVLGAGIVGPRAGDLIAEAALAIEMGADANDLALTIHPHPTLSETVGLSAESFNGTITDLYIPRKRSGAA